MEQFATYLLKSALWLALFTVLYLLFLRKERFFRLKRAYLMGSVVLSLLLPLVTIHYVVEVAASQSLLLPAEPGEAAASPAAGGQDSFPALKLFLLLYAAGAALLFVRILLWLIRLRRFLKRAPVSREGDLMLVRSECDLPACSFFNYAIISPSLSDSETREILNHELVHVQQRHWFDLLVAEAVCIMQWMNPFVWIWSALVRQNHEHLADEVALERSSDPSGYRAALLNQIFSSRLITLSNSFNFSFNTNRFEMMEKRRYSPLRKLKLLLVLPAAGVLLYAFASPRYVTAEPADLADEAEIIITGTAPIIQRSVRGVVRTEAGSPLAGVVINVSGTALKTKTGNDGRFELKDVPGDAVLLFVHRSFRIIGLKADFRREMVVTLSPAVDMTPADPAKSTEDHIFVVVEEMPSYPGGDQALMDYIYANLKYPDEAREQKISGRVTLRFVITKEGKVSDVTVVKGVDPLLDAEAVRVISGLPQWNPGKQSGVPVNVYYSVPISFRMN